MVGQRLQAGLSSMERATEEMDGVSYLLALRKLEALSPEKISRKLRLLHQRLIRSCGLQVHLGGSPEDTAAARPWVDQLIQALPLGSPEPPAVWERLYPAQPEGLLIPSPVNFVGCATMIDLQGTAGHASHHVARQLLNNDYLWERVRMQGGAYGCFSRLSDVKGRFVFTSYRDPHIDRTLDIYRTAGEWLSSLDISPETLEQAIIGTVGKMDPPERPSSQVYKSFYRHLIGLHYERRLQRWQEIMDTRLSHVHHFGQTLTQAMQEQEHICTLSGAKNLDGSKIPFTRIPI